MLHSEEKFSVGVTQSLIASLVYTVVTFIIVTLLSRFVEAWRKPILWGLLGSLMAACTAYAIVSIARLHRGTATSTRNIEVRVLAWLTKFSFTLKKDAPADFYFRVIVTTSSERKITIVRSKDEFAEYLSFVGFVVLASDEVEILGRLPAKQTDELLARVKIELSRARMGYAGLAAINDFSIFRRVPIGAELNEERFIEAVNEMEAMLNTVFQTSLLAISEAGLIHKSSVRFSGSQNTSEDRAADDTSGPAQDGSGG